MIDGIKSFLSEIRRDGGERLSSPFVVSFVVAWLVVNWNYLLVLLFSWHSIEFRIFFVKERFSDWGFMLGAPVAYAFASVVLYYSFSLIFSLIRRSYYLADAAVGRFFNGVGWVPAARLVDAERASKDKIISLEEFTAEWREEVNRVGGELRISKEENGNLQREVAANKLEISSKDSLIGSLQESVASMKSDSDELLATISRLNNSLDIARLDLKKAVVNKDRALNEVEGLSRVVGSLGAHLGAVDGVFGSISGEISSIEQGLFSVRSLLDSSGGAATHDIKDLILDISMNVKMAKMVLSPNLIRSNIRHIESLRSVNKEVEKQDVE